MEIYIYILIFIYILSGHYLISLSIIHYITYSTMKQLLFQAIVILLQLLYSDTFVLHLSSYIP